MGDKTAIAWTERTWNPVRGCSRVSEGCRNCYAEKIAARFSGEPESPFYTFARQRPARWTGKVALISEKLAEPVSWRKPSRVFVNSMSDLFHEHLSDEDIDRVFAAMARAHWHTFQILTKRADRMRRYFADRDSHLAMTRCFRNFAEYIEAVGPWPLPNVWLGVSAEDQQRADERIPLLLQTPAQVRFVSYEPALGPVDFKKIGSVGRGDDWDALIGWKTTYQSKRRHPGEGSVGVCSSSHDAGGKRYPRLDWVIVGGESGANARPFRIEWARHVVEQCRAAGVKVFVKQLGARPFGELFNGEPVARDISHRAGADPDEWPEDLRVQEFPAPSPERDIFGGAA